MANTSFLGTDAQIQPTVQRILHCISTHNNVWFEYENVAHNNVAHKHQCFGKACKTHGQRIQFANAKRYSEDRTDNCKFQTLTFGGKKSRPVVNVIWGHRTSYIGHF